MWDGSAAQCFRIRGDFNVEEEPVGQQGFNSLHIKKRQHSRVLPSKHNPAGGSQGH
ncbi:UNVERIFIED_CONTAM: hypothetical protein FKN15_061307 [Acipenser sinensis]